MVKIIYNKLIPFKGYVAINLFGFIFARKEYESKIERDYVRKTVLLNHEMIHTAQYKELLYIFYIILYLLNYLVNLFVYFNFKKAYKNICFEREAKTHEYSDYYVYTRRHFAWIGYILHSKI